MNTSVQFNTRYEQGHSSLPCHVLSYSINPSSLRSRKALSGEHGGRMERAGIGPPPVGGGGWLHVWLRRNA